jgi:hypothetical protein
MVDGSAIVLKIRELLLSRPGRTGWPQRHTSALTGLSEEGLTSPPTAAEYCGPGTRWNRWVVLVSAE